MQSNYHVVSSGVGIDLSGAADMAQPRCIRGNGRGSHALLHGDALSLWFCMAGRLEIDAGDLRHRLHRRRFLALPAGTAPRGAGRDAAQWCVITVPSGDIAGMGRRGDLRRLPEPLLLPTALPINRPLLRALVAFIRHARSHGESAGGILLDTLLQAAVQAQAPADDWLQRACGRSAGHRRQVVVRLLSARNRILNAPFMEHDLDTLAATARYSKSHFLRLFRDVFGSTPHDLLIEARMDMAKRLILDGELAIAEVAASVGYESRYAFSRLFKKRVGMTASDYRNDTLAPVAHAA